MTAARIQAEQLLEQKALELYQALQTTERAREALESAAHTDELTGLANRRQLSQRFESLLSLPVGLIVLDLDGFKPINDHFGHEAGDQVLQVTAQRIRDESRISDLVTRLGGDEFGVLCPGIESESTLSNISERIRARLMEPIVVEERSHIVSASIGIAMTAQAQDLNELLSRADHAMYQSKRGGKNRATLALTG